MNILAELRELIILEISTLIKEARRNRNPLTLYVFDFDHTIALTVEESKRLPDGRMDLNAFMQVADDTKPNKAVFRLFAGYVEKHPDTTFILTARPRQAKTGIVEFLKRNGVEFSRDSVIALGDSSPNKKRNWIADKLEELGAGAVKFWDDREKNCKAVEMISNPELYPDLKHVKVEVNQVMGSK